MKLLCYKRLKITAPDSSDEMERSFNGIRMFRAEDSSLANWSRCNYAEFRTQVPNSWFSAVFFRSWKRETGQTTLMPRRMKIFHSNESDSSGLSSHGWLRFRSAICEKMTSKWIISWLLSNWLLKNFSIMEFSSKVGTRAILCWLQSSSQIKESAGVLDKTGWLTPAFPYCMHNTINNFTTSLSTRWIHWSLGVFLYIYIYATNIFSLLFHCKYK